MNLTLCSCRAAFSGSRFYPITLKEGARRLTIRLGPERQRAIAQLRLPITHVSFEFRGFSLAQIDAFTLCLSITFSAAADDLT